MADQSNSEQNEKIIELLGQIADKGKTRDEEDKAKKDADSRKQLRGKIAENTIGLIGLTKSMFSLKGMAGNILSMGSDLARNLGQVGQATEGMTAATDRFIKGAQGTEQSIKVFADAVSLGMVGFTDRTLQFGASLKVLGVQNKTAFQLMRANTQALGLSEESSLTMTDSLISTAIANKDSIEGLIGALNSMRDAMVSTTVELGPKAALNAQKIAARMSQGNTELQEASARFVKSFLAGTDGFMKAAKLGVVFTGQEGEEEMAQKFEEILMKIGDLGGGRQGAGSQFLFDAFEQSLGITREDFMLQQRIGSDIKALSEGQVSQRAAESASINLEQQMLNNTNVFQNSLLQVNEGMARGIAGISDGIGQLDKLLNDLFGTDFFSMKDWFLPAIGAIMSGAGLAVGAGATAAAARVIKPGMLGKVGKFAKGFLGKVALPVTAVMAVVDGVQGGLADPNAGLGGTLKNVGNSILDGLTFGLLGESPEEIKARAQNASIQAAGGVEPPSVAGAGANAGLLGAINENTAVLKEILETNQEGNSLTETQTTALSDGGYIPIGAGRRMN